MRSFISRYLASGVVLLAFSKLASAAIVFQGIGFAPGETYSKATALSGSGDIVVGVGGASQAIRWASLSGSVSVPGTNTWGARDVAAGGSSVVGSNSAGGAYGSFWRWTQDTGTVSVPAQVRDPFVEGASDGCDRVLVSGFEDAGSVSKVVNLEGTVLLSSGYNVGGFSAISNNGNVVVGHDTTTGAAYRVFLGGGTQSLGDLPGGATSSFASDLSANGGVIVGQGTTANGSEAFRWQAGNMNALGDLPGGAIDSAATDVSDDGAVIIGRGRTAAGDEPFIWDAVHGMRNLGDLLRDAGAVPAGWILVEATDVSGNGSTVAGWGINPAGQTEGWVASVPEPASFGLFAAAFLLLTRGRRLGR